MDWRSDVFAHYLESNWILGCKGKSHKGEVSL